MNVILKFYYISTNLEDHLQEVIFQIYQVIF